MAYHYPHVIHNYLDHLHLGHRRALDFLLDSLFHNVLLHNPFRWGMIHAYRLSAHILPQYPTDFHTRSRTAPPSHHCHNGISIPFAVHDCPEACLTWR